jgi:hypothetical protein
MPEETNAWDLDVWFTQSRKEEILPSDDICVWEQRDLSESVLVDSFLHWFVWDGRQWEDQMQTVFGELPDELLGLGGSNETVLEWEFRWGKTVPVNQQQSGGAHWLDAVDYRNQWGKNQHRRCAGNSTHSGNHPRCPFSLWVLAIKICKK